MESDLLSQLTALLVRLDDPAQQPADKGNARRECYGVMFGIEIAR
jgi:hypothetical protein